MRKLFAVVLIVSVGCASDPEPRLGASDAATGSDADRHPDDAAAPDMGVSGSDADRADTSLDATAATDVGGDANTPDAGEDSGGDAGEPDVTRNVCLRETDRGADGTIDQRRVFEYDDEGRTTFQGLDLGADGTFETSVRYEYDADTTTEYHFEGTDSDYDIVIVTRFDGDGRPVEKTHDTNLDGVDDIRIVWNYTATTAERRSDYQNDGVVDSVERETFDSEGRVVLYENDEDADGTNEQTTTNTYDANGLLVRVEYFDGETTHVQRYEYDAMGRQTRFESDLQDDGTPDQVTTTVWDDVALTATHENDLDADGTVDQVTVATYDASGKLLKWKTENATDEYDYDEHDRLVERRQDSGNDGSFDLIQRYEYECE